ncbi:MAG: isoleucine--tRNA ligase [Candidatus Nealsonbacteria bacterium]
METILPKIEKEILEFWKKNKIFKKSLEKTKDKPRFVFYEGPPFANGLPGIHHLLARAFKDIILRYKTMQGFFVERKAGWDTHGLPTEMSAEKSLKINGKKEIENNIERFVEECKNNVFTYKKDWEEFTERIGFWLDLESAYVTCNNDYIESLWWSLKQIWDKDLLYQDYKVVPFCPRCGTSLSSHEVAQGYKLVKDNSVFVKFPLKNQKNTYFLVWTTTPWTLPGNVAVALNPKFTYVKAEINGETLILAKERAEVLLGDDYKILKEVKGKELLNLEYEPLFNFHKPEEKAWFSIPADFVSLEEGTGLVHIAPAFGEEDMEVGKKNNLPVILNVNEEGKFIDKATSFSGKFVKDADPLIIDDLRKRKLLFKEQEYEHEYPFCWRCDTPLLYYAKESWFIKMTAVKNKLLENNKNINWIPNYLKDGRFGEWLKEVKDWNLSRERYWGTPLPIWQCQKCSKRTCIGSIAELKDRSGIDKIEDLHRPFIDGVLFECDCGGKMKRVKEVIDCWFDSGSVPFAQLHYPFEDKDLIDKGKFFPADFICEGIDQTRGWFYTLLAISTLLGKGTSYKNVVSVGIVLDEKGQKMSKSKGNIVKPADIIDVYGADVARFYFYTINAVAEPKSFSFKDVQALYRRFFDTVINTQKFFKIYVKENLNKKGGFKSDNPLDRWIVSLIERLNLKVVEKLEGYDVVGAARLFDQFVDDLSNWYVRRSRKRFQKEGDKKAGSTLYYVLFKLSCLLAPFTPFLAEFIYRELGEKGESVHLEDYPLAEKKFMEEKMKRVREIVNLGLKERVRLAVKVRQPLSELVIGKMAEGLEDELLDLVKEELNVKTVKYNKDLKETVKLDETITAELKEEGILREIMHSIQVMRKKADLKPQDQVSVGYGGDEELVMIYEKNKDSIIEDAKIKVTAEIKGGETFDSEKEIKIDDKVFKIAIRKL